MKHLNSKLTLQDFELDRRLDNQLIAEAKDVLAGSQAKLNLTYKISNEQRTFGATLSNKVGL